MLDRPTGAGEAPTALQRERFQATGRPDANESNALIATVVFATLRRHKWFLLAPVLLVPLFAFIAIQRITPLYTATGTLLYDSSEYKLRELQSILRVDPITDAVMATQAEILRGLPVVRPLAMQLNLFDNPEFNHALNPPSLPRRVLNAARNLAEHLMPALARPPGNSAAEWGPNLDSSRNSTLAVARDALRVTPLKLSHVLEVSFTADDPVIAAAGANAAMDLYVKNQLGQKYGAVTRAREWLEERAKALRREVNDSEDKIARYRANNRLIAGVRAPLGTEQVSQLAEALDQARNDLAQAEGRLDAASGRAGAAAQAAIAPSVVPLRDRHNDIASQLAISRLGPNHPDITGLHDQLAEADRALAAAIGRVVAASDADVRAGRARIAVLEQQLRTAQSSVQRDAEAQVPLNGLQRDMEASSTLLQAVLERLQETVQQQAIETPDAHEISLALAPDKPSYPLIRPLMAAATASGLLLGLLSVYLRDLADSTFRSSEEIRSVLGLPCFALLPKVKRRALGQLAISEYAARKPLSALAEQIRALRAALWSWPDHPRVVAVTAARQAEGKTTVSLALGRMAAMNGERVVVLDCDVRQPSFGQLLEPSGQKGIIDCLQETATLAEVIHKDALTGMDYILAGTPSESALGLLMSASMAHLLLSLRQDYDLVLLDVPPAQAITHARIVAALADATLLCVRWRSTPHRIVQHALELLEMAHANVVGAALTQIDVRVHVRSGFADAEVYHPRYGGYFRE